MNILIKEMNPEASEMLVYIMDNKSISDKPNLD